MNTLRLKPADRLGIAVFLAGLLHLIFILGLRFDVPHASSSGTALDVTLVQAASAKKPRHAARLAQVNVQGGGGTHRRHMAHTPFAATHTGGAEEHRKTETKNQAQVTRHLRMLHEDRSPLKVSLVKPTWQLHAAIAETLGLTKQFAAEEARLKAEIRREWRAYKTTGRGRGGVTARQFAYAQYIERWNRHMEHVGSRQYRQLLAGRRLTGSLILDIKIRSNGSLQGVRIVRGSGNPLLDQAALVMVRGAAPFAPLPHIAGAPIAILPIIETWHFRGDHMADATPAFAPGP